MENIAPISETSVDESKVHGLPELNMRDPQHKAAEPAASAHEVSTHTKKETNPIILVFKAMIVAKGILREGLKETKNSNRRHERQWEAIALEQQNEHKKTAASQKKWGYAYVALPVIQLSGTMGSQWLKAKDAAWATATSQSLNDFSDRRGTYLQYVSRPITDRMVSFLSDEKNYEHVDSFTRIASNTANDGIRGQIDNLRVLNDAEQAPLQMKTQSASSLYQNRGSEESSDKQQLSEVDRLMRDLMQQESQVFQGSSGRG